MTCVCVYLEDVCFEDVVTQLNGLLPVELALLPGEPEGQQCVATPRGESQTGHTLSPSHYKKIYFS